jgi:H/ACA ribonucleoprotein complex subunit 2
LKHRVKEVVKSISRGKKGFCVIVGNISPVYVIMHVSIMCEVNIPYIFVPLKEDLAGAGATKRSTCCVSVLTSPTKGRFVRRKIKKIERECHCP